MLYFAAVVFALVGIFFYLRYTAKYSKNLIHIGLSAAQTYIMFGEAAAFCAARTVCASMSQSHKKQLLEMFAHIPISAEGVDEVAAKDRQAMLLVKARSDTVGLSFSVAMKNELKEKSEEWLEAVIKCDLDKADRLYKEAVVRNVMDGLRNEKAN